MIKTVTVREKRVFCDICGSPTYYQGDSGYAAREFHFCQLHQSVEQLIERLLDMHLPLSAETVFKEAKENFEKREEGVVPE